jgi:hypothetical protein
MERTLGWQDYTGGRWSFVIAVAALLLLSGCCSDDADCATGQFCTTGRCVSFRCVEEPRDCSDGVDCTTDSCDEPTAACLNAPDDAACDDGLFCTGPERCEPATGCEDGAPPECSDGVACTDDLCDEAADACTSTPDDAFCDDGLYCDGEERCDPSAGCLAGAPPECVDGVDCTTDQCDESADACRFDPDHGACDDGVACTLDACDLVTGCASTPDDSLCDDGDPCNGAETCDPSTGCQPGVPVDCDDGRFCNGLETCSPSTGECLPGTPPDCSDGFDCTTDRCIETTDSCSHTPEHALCDDGLFCNGTESCSLVVGCRVGPPPLCSSDDDCHEGVCDETADVCDSLPLTGTLCDAGGGSGSGVCDDGVCVFRGCGDGFLEPGSVPPAEECDPGPDLVETPGCTAECESVDFRVSDLLPTAEQNGSQELGAGDRAVTALSDGRFVVVWTRDIGGACGAPCWPDAYCYADVEARIFTARGALDGDAIRVHDDPGGMQHQAVVTALGDGFLVVWAGDRIDAGDRGGIFARPFDGAGAPRRRGTRVDTLDISVTSDPTITGTPDGALVVWRGPLASGDAALLLRWLDMSGTPEAAAEQVVASESWGNLWEPTASVSFDGAAALVVWRNVSFDIWEDDRLEARLYNVATGEPLGDGFDLAGPEAGVRHVEPTVVALDDGGFFALWRRIDGGTAVLEGRSLASDGSMEPTTVVLSDPPDVDDFLEPTASQLDDGTLAIAWTDERFPSADALGSAVAGIRSDLTGPVTPAQLNTTTTSWQHTPHLAVSGDGALALCFTDEGLDEAGDRDPGQVRCRVLPAGWIVE